MVPHVLIAQTNIVIGGAGVVEHAEAHAERAGAGEFVELEHRIDGEQVFTLIASGIHAIAMDFVDRVGYRSHQKVEFVLDRFQCLLAKAQQARDRAAIDTADGGGVTVRVNDDIDLAG